MKAALHRSIARTALALASAVTVYGNSQPCAAQAELPFGKVVKPAVATQGPSRNTVSEQELRKQTAATPGFDALMAKQTKPVGEVRPSTEGSLMTSSLFLFDGEMFTIVPVGSILHLPPAYRNRVIAKPEGTFTFWPNFLKRNSKWLGAKEVPLKMAKGDSKLAKAVLQEVSADRRVVVSVYKGGPITILEPVPGSENSSGPESPKAETASSNPGGKP